MYLLYSTGAYSAVVIVCSMDCRVHQISKHWVSLLSFGPSKRHRAFSVSINAYNGHPRDRLFGHISARESDLKVINNKNWTCGKLRSQYKSFSKL